MRGDLQLGTTLHSQDLMKVDRLAGASAEHAWPFRCTHALWVDGSTHQQGVLQLEAPEMLLGEQDDLSSSPHHRVVLCMCDFLYPLSLQL